MSFDALAIFGRFTDPDRSEVLAAMWAQVAPGSLDSAALDAISLLLLFPVLYFLVVGVLMLYYCRNDGAAPVIAVLVVAVELFAWIPLDIYAVLFNGWAWSDVFGLIAVHALVGVSGIAAIVNSRFHGSTPKQS